MRHETGHRTSASKSLPQRRTGPISNPTDLASNHHSRRGDNLELRRIEGSSKRMDPSPHRA
jgi:hypothetical protein